MAQKSLYPKISKDKGYTSAMDVLNSSMHNIEQHQDIDDLKEKCLRFVQGKHFDPDQLDSRTSEGLPSVVADETLAVFKTLDGYARKSRINVEFSPLGSDDYEGAKLRTTVFSSTRSASGLQARQAEVYGSAAVLSEAYLYLYPEQNVRGELEPSLYAPMAFECYPDCNTKDPIWMKDARFIDLRLFMHVEAILEEMGDFLSEEDKKTIGEWTPANDVSRTATRNQSTDRGGKSKYSQNGLVLVIKRFYKVNMRSVQYLVDDETNEERRLNDGDLESDLYVSALHKDPAMAKSLNMHFEKQDEEWLWSCVLIPAIATDKFFHNAPEDFQPVDPRTRRKLWPILRLPHLYAAGKIIGAVQTILSLQEYRNLLLSAFVHHIQTAANGALGYEEGAFKDPNEEEKFKTKRNRAHQTIKFAPIGPDKRSAKEKVFVMPKGEFAFADGGQAIEEIFKDLIQKLTGSTSVIRGEAQKGSPASLYKQQTEQADNNMQGTTDLYKEFQYACADLYNNFHQQFFTEERWLEIEGPSKDPMQMVINQQTAMGVKNDITRGLYAVRKSEAAPTESARRQRLSDNVDIIKALVEAQLPAFLADYESVIENMDIPEARRDFYLQNLQIWRQSQGLVANAQAQGQAMEAQAMGGQAQAQQAVNQELQRYAGGGQQGQPQQPPQPVPANAGAAPAGAGY
jgi:hypothetical protein